MLQRKHQKQRSRLLPFLMMLPVWVMWTASLHYANVTILVRKQNKEDTPTPHQFDAVAKDKRRGESTAQFFRDQTAHSILQQSLCDARSSFLKVGIDDESSVDSNNPRRTVTTWAARLVYLMLYEHQNHEMSLVSSNNSCEKNTTTKFLVFSYGKNGLGANMRLGAVPALMLGLVTDRVVVNVNNAKMGPAFLQEPWPWAMCSLRNAECYFRPLSNDCWRTEELETAHVLTKAEARSAFRTGRMPEAHQDDRFLILHVTYRPQREPETLRSFVSHKVRAMATRLRWIQATVVQEAIDIISAVPTISKGEYDYYGANSVIFHGLLLYAMRPNPSLINKLERNVDEVSRRFDVSTVGVPVRASDKCERESQCLATGHYMAAAMEVRPKASSLFLTTEAKTVEEEAKRFAKEYPVARILTNHHDVHPDTGFLANTSLSTLGDVIPAALSSIQAQFRTSFVLGNCCSNFHLLIKDFVDVGCGTVEHFQCLQTHANEVYRLCCSWDRGCVLNHPSSESLYNPVSIT